MRERHRLAAAKRERVAHGGGGVADDRCRHARASSAAVASALVSSAAQAAISACSSGRARDAAIAVREPLVLHQLRSSERREDALARSLGRRAEGDIAVARLEDPEQRQPRDDVAVRIAIPARSIVSHGSVAMSEVSAPSSETSTCWPCPVRSRW